MIELLITALGAVAGVLARHYLAERQWQRIKALAEAIVADPSPATTSDPVEAVVQAVIETNRRRIARTSGEIALPLNGMNGKNH